MNARPFISGLIATVLLGSTLLFGSAVGSAEPVDVAEPDVSVEASASAGTPDLPSDEGVADDAEEVVGSDPADADPSDSDVADETVEITQPLIITAAASDADSFQLQSSEVPIKPGHTVVRGACGGGYAVRQGVPPYNDRAATVLPAFVKTAHHGLISASAEQVDYVTTVGGVKLYSGISVTFFNASFISGTASFTWWCDAIPSWNATVDSGFDPIPSDCYFCGDGYLTLQNAATGLFLQGDNLTFGAENPVSTMPQNNFGNQTWMIGGLLQADVGADGIPQGQLSIQTGQYITTQQTIHEDPSTHLVTLKQLDAFHGLPNSVWSYVYFGPSPVNSGFLIVNSATQRCLAGPENANDSVFTLPCNTTDRSQWWGRGTGAKVEQDPVSDVPVASVVPPVPDASAATVAAVATVVATESVASASTVKPVTTANNIHASDVHNLAATGVSIAWAQTLGLGLIIGGAALCFGMRRRHRSRH